MQGVLRTQVVLLLIWVILSGVALGQVPQLINYQGVLIDPETDQSVADATYSMTFSIYDAASGGTAIWTEIQSVDTKNGLYSVLLGSITPWIGGALSGPEKYLGIKVGIDPEMIPRKRIASVAYSILCTDAYTFRGLSPEAFTDTVHTHDDRYYTEWELRISDGTPPNQGSNRVSWDNLTDVPAGFADGVDNTGTGPGNCWLLTGNAGTNPGTNFLGSTDNQALELRVNNLCALRLEPHPSSPNLIGGYNGNSIMSGVKGANISGGGVSGDVNSITDDYGTVGGGRSNRAGDGDGSPGNTPFTTVGGGVNNIASGASATVGGGNTNVASGSNATVGGGLNNTASGTHCATVAGGSINTANSYGATVGGGIGNNTSGLRATIAGGSSNVSSGDYATVGGGESNEASGYGASVAGGWNNTANTDYTTVGGGRDNIAGGQHAMVPGGRSNTAAGAYSFAAGRRAKANHNGAFVWADQTDADFTSTAMDQFLIRASGGVGIGTTSPGSRLHIEGSGNSVSTSSLNVTDSGGTSMLFIRDDGNVGVGTTSPSQKLHVEGNARVGGNATVTGRINNAAFRSSAAYNGGSDMAVDMAGINMDQGEVHFGNTGNDQWVDMWFIYSNNILMGNYIKYDGSTTTSGHFRLTTSGVILYSKTDATDSAGYAYWDRTNNDVLIYEASAFNNYCEWWSYDRRN